ncbi:prolyl oligopeptidase family serine peptidase [Salinimicrobium gaetbulicola]|uniref:prolyl oligopeptidase n=1 Tax=Salinimicrobium gaetbulicola TaxID=999702 RepID=A0ABW3ICJ6_9FLAO
MKNSALLIFMVIGMYAHAQKTYEYPDAPKESVFDTYFEETVPDPYQWMENPADPRLKSWLAEQEKLTHKQTKRQTHIWDLRAQIYAMFRGVRREKTDDFVERDPKLQNKYDFKNKWNNNSLELLYKPKDKKNYKRLFRAKDLLENKNDHLQIEKVVNEEENLVAIAVSVNGSDWATGYVFDLVTGAQIPFKLENIRGAGFSWHGRDLYYDAYERPETGRELLDKAKGQKLYRLSIADSSSHPVALYRNPDTTGTNRFSFDIIDDRLVLNHYLKSNGTWYRAISVADLKKEYFQPQRFLVFPSEEGTELKITHIKNDSVFLRTNIGAPHGKVLLANVNRPNQLSEFIPEYDIDLQYMNKLGKDKLACVYLKEGQNIALIFNLKGELLKKIDFPKGKKLNHFYEESDEAEFTSFSISSFFHPLTWYQISLDDLEFKATESLTVPYNIEDLETRYVTYTSKDGEEIPMYITCGKETVLDGNNPVLMYGYGGYGVTVEPFFSQSTGLLLAHGGILAVPNIRGGGAKGDAWALEGRRLKKQNAIDDFIAAGEYLIDNKYTNPGKLVITGGSHGAMLVSAASTQRPELFKAVIAEAGPYDMLRFNKFTVGAVNTNLREFGDPTIREDYNILKSYSPLHSLQKDKKYPNMLLITGDSDDRVPPHHSYKFLAQIQEFGDPAGLYHMYLTPGSGHGGALTPEDAVEKLLFEYYFLFDQLDIRFY